MTPKGVPDASDTAPGGPDPVLGGVDLGQLTDHTVTVPLGQAGWDRRVHHGCVQVGLRNAAD